jgi:ribosome-binding protein aMBF1 (putative translation factor)
MIFPSYRWPMATTPRSNDFDLLLDQIEAEAHHEGPAGVADLRALTMKYALVNQLLERRRELHWTQKELSQRAGIGQAVISKIERGRLSPTLDTYARLAAVLGLSLQFQVAATA